MKKKGEREERKKDGEKREGTKSIDRTKKRKSGR